MSESEKIIRSACERGDLQLAATLALRELGPEVMRFLRARLRAPALTEEAYLQFCEDFWAGLPSFRWQCGLRGWMFLLARAAATRLGLRAHHRRELLLADETGSVWQARDEVRATTALFLQTQVKDRMSALREQLAEEEQTLLVLRVNRGLSWREIAVAMGEVSADADETELARAAARVRTRFQAAKKRLRKLATRDGLLTAKDGSEERC